MKKNMLIIILFILSMIGGYKYIEYNHKKTHEKYLNMKKIEYTVKKGDTLWNIAKNNAKGFKDVREGIYAIEYINKLKAENLKEGMIIYIPINE